MRPACPYCHSSKAFSSDNRNVVRFGCFPRTSDGRKISRFRCLTCKRTFSHATFDECRWQKKRQFNFKILTRISSCESQRRTAFNLGINRKTVAARIRFLGLRCRVLVTMHNFAKRKSNEVEFDEMETFEHTKCKPISIPLAVEAKTRRILSLRVASMPAKGRLVHKAKRLYGPRRDERNQKRKAMLRELKKLCVQNPTLRSDSNPHYPRDVKKIFPDALYVQVEGQRGAITGQGELKKIAWDPIFSLNHTCAMFRANLACLVRKTWCTTKKREYLEHRLWIYAYFHNTFLI